MHHHLEISEDAFNDIIAAMLEPLLDLLTWIRIRNIDLREFRLLSLGREQGANLVA